MALSTGLASADWDGPDPAVTQVLRLNRAKQNGMLFMGSSKQKKNTFVVVVFLRNFCFL